MSTLTKEWLKHTIAELEEERDAVPGAVNEDAAMALAAMKIALGALEAEPIYQLVNDDWYDTDKDTYDVVVSSGARGRIVYTAPPASVAVPDAIHSQGEKSASDDYYALGWNACRAAMLQGAEPDFRENAETSTKCWCRTCRPVTFADSHFVVCPECGNKRCPHANDHRHACTGSNEPGQEGSAYPAAPQHEISHALAKGMERYGDAMQELAKKEVK